MNALRIFSQNEEYGFDMTDLIPTPTSHDDRIKGGIYVKPILCTHCLHDWIVVPTLFKMDVSEIQTSS